MNKFLKVFLYVFGSCFTLFLLFLLTGWYTLGDLPTKYVVIRYLALTGILLIFSNIFVYFIKKCKKNKYLLLSGLSILPIIIVDIICLLFSILPFDSFEYSGLSFFLLLVISFVPSIILAVISLKKGKDKLTKKISKTTIILWIAFWGLVLFFLSWELIYHLFIYN